MMGLRRPAGPKPSPENGQYETARPDGETRCSLPRTTTRTPAMRKKIPTPAMSGPQYEGVTTRFQLKGSWRFGKIPNRKFQGRRLMLQTRRTGWAGARRLHLVCFSVRICSCGFIARRGKSRWSQQEPRTMYPR